MRVTAQEIIKTYYATPVKERAHSEWRVRKTTFQQIHDDVYPIGISQELMGRPVVIDHKMTEGKIKFVPEEEKK